MFTTCTGTTKYVTMRRNVPKEQRAVMDSAAVNSTDPAGTALRAGTEAQRQGQVLRRISHLAARVADVDPTVVGEEDHGHAEADQTEKADEARFGRLRGAAGGGGGEEQAAKDQRDEAQDLRHGQEDLR